MAQAKGANARVIIQKETTFGVAPVTPAAKLVHFLTCGVRLSRALERSETIRGNRNPSAPARGNQEVSGPLSVELQGYTGRLFEAALGSVTTTGATAPYTHTFKIGASLPSYLIEKGFTDVAQYFRYLGCKCSRMSMTLSPAGFQRLEFDFMGVSESVSGTSYHAAATDLGKKSFDGFSVGSILEGGSAIADIVGIDLTLDNSLDGDQYVIGGQGKRSDIPEGTVMVSGNVRARFADLALYNKAISSTKSSLAVTYALGTGAGTAGNESIEFKVPELTYSPNAPVVEGPRGVIVDLPFEAFYDTDAGASALQVIVKNTEATI